MDKEFNIFGEFESVEDIYKADKALEASLSSNDDDEDLDSVLETKKKEAAEAVSKLASKEDDLEEEEEDEDDSPDEDKHTSEDTEDEKSLSNGYSFKALASALAEEGVIDFEDNEEDEDNIEVISNAVMNTAKNLLSEYKDSLPEEGKKFLNYIEKGGDPSKYINKLSEVDFTTLDITEESNQKKVLKEYLKKSDYNDEEIDDLLQDYEDGMILEKQAKFAQKRLEKILEKEQELLIKSQEKELQDRQEKYNKHIEVLQETIDTSDTLAGVAISKADKKALRDYMLTTDKDGLTQWNKDLKEGGIKTQLALAYLQMKKFNYSKLSTKAATEVTKKYKDIFDGKNTTVKGRSKHIETDGKGNLSGFNSLLA